MPDGTVVFTSPTGHRYATQPGGALLFPVLATPTGQPAPPAGLDHSLATELAANPPPF